MMNKLFPKLIKIISSDFYRFCSIIQISYTVMNLDRFKDIEKIVVHRGSAHRDDLIAVSLILGSIPGSCMIVERRDSTDEDLNDPKVLVVDQGRKHQPELNNFDHHHFPLDQEPVCSITLILQALECYEAAQMIWQWLKPSEIQDVKGPNLLAKELEIPGGGEVLMAINQSPVEGYILNQFSKLTTIQPGESLFELLEEMGISLLSGLKKILDRLEDLKVNAKAYEVAGKKVIDNSYIDKDNHPGRAMNLYRKHFHPDAQVSISSDKRGDGISMTRTNDDGVIDFQKIKDAPGVRFVHASGFMASLDQGVDPIPLIEKSIIKD